MAVVATNTFATGRAEPAENDAVGLDAIRFQHDEGGSRLNSRASPSNRAPRPLRPMDAAVHLVNNFRADRSNGTPV